MRRRRVRERRARPQPRRRAIPPRARAATSVSSCKDSVKRGRGSCRRMDEPPPSVERPLPKRLLLIAVVVLAFPRPAAAADATIVTRDVPLRGERTLAATTPPVRFNLVGLHWRGPGTVQFRTRSLTKLERLVDAAPEAEDRPDAGTPERARAGTWRLGNPWWVGPRTGSSTARTAGLRRAHFVWSPADGVPAHAAEGGCAGDRHAAAGTPTRRPPRSPAFATSPVAVVHHTAGAIGYSAAQSPAIVRAIQLYHEGQRLERHRLQLPRRPLRHRLRGAAGSSETSSARMQRFNTGTVGVAGEYSPWPSRRRRGSRSRSCPRLAARRRRRGPATTQSFISAETHAGPGCPCSCARSPAPRHRLHRLSGYRALQPAHGNRRRGREDRPAEAVRAARHRHRPGACPLPGATVGAAAVDGRRLRLGRKCRGLELGARPERRLDLGRDPVAAGQLLVLDPLGCAA